MSTRRTLRVMLGTTVLLCSVFVVALVLLRNWDSRGEELLTSPQEAPPIDQSEVSMRVDRRSTSNEFDQGSVTTPASIRVLDESGIPLPGAILIDAIEGRWKRVDAVPAYGTSDAEGVISIHSDQTESKFALFKSGYRITLVELQRGSRIDVTLRQGQIYTAQAVTLEGMPLQGVIYVISQWPLPDPVRSSVFPRDGEACMPGLRSNDAIYCGITDERGIVVVPGLPDGEHYAACYHPTHVRVRPNPRRVSVPAVEQTAIPRLPRALHPKLHRAL